MQLSFPAESLPAVVLLAAAPAQTTHHVQGPDLQRAIDAAAPGDILLVRGTFLGSVCVAKPLHVHGLPDAVIFSIDTPALQVMQIPAGTTLVWQGFEPNTPLSVHDCPGTVLMAGLRAAPTFNHPSAVIDCAQVAFDECETGSLAVQRSTVLLTRSRLHGNDAIARLNVAAAPGMAARESTVVAVDTEFHGVMAISPSPGRQVSRSTVRGSG